MKLHVPAPHRLAPSVAIATALAVALAGCTTTSSPGPTATAISTATPTQAATPTPTAAPPTAAPTAPAPTEIPTATPELPAWVCDGSQVHLPGTVVRAQQIGLGTSDEAGLGRVEFMFQAPAGTRTVPEILVRESKPPFTADPSGQPLDVGGSAWATIVLQGGTGLDENYQPTYTGKDDIVMDASPIREVRRAGDFEAVSTWIVGLDAPYCVRVYTTASGASGVSSLVVEFRAK